MPLRQEPTNPKNNNNPSKEILSTGIYLAQDNGGLAPNTPQELINRRDNVNDTSTTINPNSRTILPASGAYSTFQQAIQSGAIPELLSSAKWSDDAQGFPQQTFLGASIRSFTMQGGFGDTSSSLTVDLIVDEYNPSDRTPAGQGDDVYHSGGSIYHSDVFINHPTITKQQKPLGDNFVPPIPGSPVFFKFGPNFATVEEAYRKTFDDLYDYNTITQSDPTVGGTVSLESVINGNFNFTKDQYVSLYLPDGSAPNETAGRPIINYSAIRNTPFSRGKDHIVFGGILQTYNQSRATNGNPLYTVNVIDPREILSNVTLILNNYAGPTYEQPNVMNIYGFLEYNPTDATIAQIKGMANRENKLKKEVVLNGSDAGNILLSGDDKYYKGPDPSVASRSLKNQIKIITNRISETKRKISEFRSSGNIVGANAQYIQLISDDIVLRSLKVQLKTILQNSEPSFPMTGTGFSRRSSQGIPYYRIKDAINALMEYSMGLPKEYKDQGFGGKINFRGFNYVVDFSGLPELPPFYYLDFDQINLLELALEICDVTNRDLFVSLLPVINHPACANIHNYNRLANPQDIIAGIIKLDTIDRSEQPSYGAIKNYIDSLTLDRYNPIYVENQDLGYELSNVTTDKFIVGAQEIDMYFFSTNADRDTLAFRKTTKNGVFPGKPQGYQWTLEASLEQQVLPYYGKLGNNAVTIPKGFGAYQQILLDSSSLNAAGVGSYYVATEMELRCALISFDRWKEFLKLYNDTYMDSLESDDDSDRGIATGLQATPIGVNPPVLEISNNYAVSVPRSVFDTYAKTPYGTDGLPSSPCNPPYGYPLYYKRMTKIGIPEGGLTDLYTRWTTLTTNLAQLQSADRRSISGLLNSQFNEFRAMQQSGANLTDFEKRYYEELERLLRNNPNPTAQQIQNTIGTLEDAVNGNGRNIFAILPSVAKKNTQNALKVYNFVKSVAEECLGKKFLVKIPREVNLFFDNKIQMNHNDGEYVRGPFGFKPRSTKNIAGYEFSKQFEQEILAQAKPTPPTVNMMQSFLSSAISPNPATFGGALRINYNPLSEKYESNYTPVNIGGYFDFDLYQNTLGVSAIKDISNANFNKLPLGVSQGLIPQDLTNFLNSDGRISPYVRFDNAETLTLEGLNDSDFTQQFIVGNAMIPDLVEALDNTGPDEFHTFPNVDEQQNQQSNQAPQPKQVAFVKCSVEEELYLPPKVVSRQVQVHGQRVKDIGTKSLPNQIFIPCSGLNGNVLVPGTGVWMNSYSFYKANFVPLPIPGANVNILDFERYDPFYNLPGGSQLNNSWYVYTEKEDLNLGHAYALITLPNRISPNKDARHRDSHFQSVNAERFKHLMTMDTVRDLPGFQLPSNPINRPLRGPLSSQIQVPIDTRIHAWFAMKKALTGLNFGFPYQVNVSVPSPIYPDLVALPLMSNDRCYGPWVSSQLDGQAYLLKNIGGRVDFVKDENLSPWNYGGYYLMDQAGRLQAEFSNSLLLFSERGSFTIPSIPKGNSLCRTLTLAGPLVTSINMDVSTGGARTTYQMDLYTASFGKLQKQKQEEISKISRERKKLQSERNALVRKGLGKNQSSRNIGNEYAMIARGEMPGVNEMGLGMANSMTRLVASVSSDTSSRWPSSATSFGSSNFGSVGSQGISVTQHNFQGSAQDETAMGKTAQLFVDSFDMARSYYDSASSELVGNAPDGGSIFIPASHGPHANMPSRPHSNVNAHHSLLYTDINDGEKVILRDPSVTIYGDRM